MFFLEHSVDIVILALGFLFCLTLYTFDWGSDKQTAGV